MVHHLRLCLLLLCCTAFFGSFYSQEQHFRFRKLMETSPETSFAFCIANDNGVLERLLSEGVQVKAVTRNWIYVQATPAWISEAKRKGTFRQFYLEQSLPKPLNDTSLVTHHVAEVHDGTGGLQTPFTGAGVIIGYVDQGIDYNHPDFQHPDGSTRVLYYWDHSLPFDALRTPQPYGYGQLWYASDINAGVCGSNEEATAHGTSVAGAGSSNAGANGKQKGVAPESGIIIVETDFYLPNWTLTIADACDFIFKKADSLGMPAVVNLSLGSYLGSHDGNDPAAELMEQLLDEQSGRIIVCAAGNSGAWGKYHAGGTVDADTSFLWLRNNPSGALGPNTIYFDLWTDLSDAGWNYALAANKPSGTYQQRAQTIYRSAVAGAGAGPIYDTLYNGSNRIATIELYPEIVGNNLHLEVYFSAVDSTSYYYAFKTTGTGKYDLWSGATLGLNAIVETLPSPGVYPPIVHYYLPDTLQTIVSSWNCSEKVISVGNLRNRFGHTDKNNNYYQPAPSYTAVPGQLSPNSSKGPNRHGVIKPDISANGDVSLSAGPLWILNNAAYNSVVDIDGWHVRNGGTSMASPIVAGIAALYLEKCHNGTYATFKNALLGNAQTDAYTGSVPNVAYGYGKAHALNTLLESNYTATVNGPSQFCGSDSAFAVAGAVIDSISWYSGETTFFSVLSGSGEVYFTSYNQQGCVAYSDTLTVVMGDIPPTPVITASGNVLSTAAFPNLQWYENGAALPGETGSSLTITLPSNSDFTVVATGTTGCEAVSAPYNPSLSIVENGPGTVVIVPNPAETFFQVQSAVPVKQIRIFDLQGNLVRLVNQSATANVSDLASGMYQLTIETEYGVFNAKILRK